MKGAFVFLFVAVFILGIVLFFVPRPALADPVTVTGIYNSRENVSANSVGILSGDTLLFGALSVIPDGTQGTTGTATQGTATIPLSFHSFSSAPHDFERAIRYTSALTN